MIAPGSLHQILLDQAREAGFALAGAVDLDKADASAHVERYDEWLAQGYAGAMDYLKRGRDRRADPKLVFPEARSIFCVAIPYPRSPVGEESGARYARYLNGGDYHRTVAEKLESVMEAVRAKSGDAGLSWKSCVDTSAVLERSWAALAGLGWIGKNTLLIHPKLGSYLFLGEVLLNRETGEGPKPMPNYCGNCTRCLEACPTKALVKPGTLDSNRCISYWTLEKRGELALSQEQRKATGRWVAGCDICQEACPFNLKPSRAETDRELRGAITLSDWRALLEETPEDYRARVKDSALKRVKPEQFRRNLAIALGNLPEEQFEQLHELAKKRLAQETDPVARAEWAASLGSKEKEKT